MVDTTRPNVSISFSSLSWFYPYNIHARHVSSLASSRKTGNQISV
uniref:Uncharacterized protein n=1 Tax=Solanum lycopersicum TaxID=4081 RepID=A0A3Q7IEC3_SOLLC